MILSRAVAGRRLVGPVNGKLLFGDLKGGLVSAVVALPQAIPLGVLAFAPLGPSHVGEGVLAGLYAAIFAGFVAALFGGCTAQISGPRASASLIMSALLAQLLVNPQVVAAGGAPIAVPLMFFAVLAAGLMQVGFGLMKLGRLIKFVPYPVIAGFMNGVAVLIVMGQLRPLLGIPAELQGWAMLGAIQPWTLLVAVATTAAILLAPRWTKAVPAPVVGLLLGSLLYHLLRPVVGPENIGVMVGAVGAHKMPWPDLAAVFVALPWGQLGGAVAAMLGTIVLLAFVASIDSLLSAVALDSMSNDRHDSNRELVGQGLSNIIGACFGGVMSTGSVARGAANWQAGGRTRLSGMVHSVLLLVLLLAGGSLLEQIPMVVLAAIMVTVALSMLDGWSRELMWRLTGPSSHRSEVLANLTVVLVVAVVTVAVNLMAAVAVGVAASMALFVRKMSKPILRAVYDGRAKASCRVRGPERRAVLDAYAEKLAVLELEGPLFFGTADMLREAIEKQAERADIIILDFRRIGETDATGVRILQQVARLMKKRGKTLYLANLSKDSPTGAYMLELAGDALLDFAERFDDLDTALEWAEDLILRRHGPGAADDAEVPLAEASLADGMDRRDLLLLSGYLRQRSYRRGEVLFRSGAPGDELHLITKGAVGIYLPRPGQGPVRLAAFNAGLVFGEMALIEHKARSADAVADEDTVTLALSARDFERIQQDHPELAAKVLVNLSRIIAQRLRDTTSQLRALA